MLRNVTSAHKGLAPSGKKYTHCFGSEKIICIFGIYPELSAGVLCSCRAHTKAKYYAGFSRFSSGLRRSNISTRGQERGTQSRTILSLDR